MVWGMNLPSGFGEFWPSGDFEGEAKNGAYGWGGRLKRYFVEQMPEEQKTLFGDNDSRYAYYVSEKLKCEVGTKPREPELPLFTPVEPQEPPQFFQTRKSYKSLASLIMFNDRIVGVDEALKDIIERLEPSVHQFFPIEIRMPRGKMFPKTYYTLVIGQYFDSFSPEQSKPDTWFLNGTTGYYLRFADRKSDMAGLAFSSTIFGKAHLWRERRFGVPLICFSDELKAEMDKVNLRTLNKFYKMKEV